MSKLRIPIMLLATVVAAVALADEGRTVIRGPAPIVITKPGHYVVGQDIPSPAKGYTVVIGSGEVTLDLNGFTLHNDDDRVIQIQGGIGGQRSWYDKMTRTSCKKGCRKVY